MDDKTLTSFEQLWLPAVVAVEGGGGGDGGEAEDDGQEFATEEPHHDICKHCIFQAQVQCDKFIFELRAVTFFVFFSFSCIFRWEWLLHMTQCHDTC